MKTPTEHLLEIKHAKKTSMNPFLRPKSIRRTPKGSQRAPNRAPLGITFGRVFLGIFKTHPSGTSRASPAITAGPLFASKPTKICRELMQNITTAEALLIILVLVIGCQKNLMTTYTHTHKQTHAHTYTHTHTHLHTHRHTHTHTYFSTHTHTHADTLKGGYSKAVPPLRGGRGEVNLPQYML